MRFHIIQTHLRCSPKENNEGDLGNGGRYHGKTSAKPFPHWTSQQDVDNRQPWDSGRLSCHSGCTRTPPTNRLQWNTRRGIGRPDPPIFSGMPSNMLFPVPARWLLPVASQMFALFHNDLLNKNAKRGFEDVIYSYVVV